MYLDKKFPFIRAGSQPVAQLPAKVEEPKEKRGAIVKGLDNDTDWLGIFNKTTSGIVVNEQTALTFSAVWAAVKLLSESVAGLPLQVFESDGKGKTMLKDHPVYSIVHDTPNPIQTRFTFLQTLMTSVLLYGNAYAKIVKDRFARPVELIFVHPDDITVHFQDGRLMYQIYRFDNKDDVYAARDMIHILGLSTDGLMGKGIIKVAQDSIGLGLASESFGNSFFSNGANSELSYESPTTLTDEQYTRLRNLLASRSQGLENAHKPLLLEGGMTIKQLTIPPEQAQFLQTRKFQVSEVGRWFNLPSHMLNDLERATNNNIEELSTEFVQYSLMPWLNRIEQEFTRKLFYEDEKPQVFAEFNVEGLLRGDIKARTEHYRVMWNIGAYNDNEIRGKENMNPYEGGDAYHRPVNMEDISNPKTNVQSENTNTDGDGETV